MTLCSLYRTYLGQVRALPHTYLRHFFTVKGADDFRSLLRTKSVALRKKKLKRLSKDLEQLRAANEGDYAAFNRTLDMAYGRVGRLRWELMQPLLSDTNTDASVELPKEKILPAYSPELVALLTSGISRTTKPLQKHQLASPPGLPGHTKSDPQDGILLGPLSRRREYNIRWRFFKNELKKVLPPLRISLQHSADPIDTQLLLEFGFQNTDTLHELLALGQSSSTLSDSLSKPRRQQIQKETQFDGRLPVRWLRRRYRSLLGRVPLLVLLQDNLIHTYNVQLADSAIVTSRPLSSRLRSMDVDDIPWITDTNFMVQSGKRHE